VHCTINPASRLQCFGDVHKESNSVLCAEPGSNINNWGARFCADIRLRKNPKTRLRVPGAAYRRVLCGRRLA
jgi:hypothetical protein